MNELLGWYGYCNSTNDDHTIEQQQFNNLPSNKMTTPDFTAILSTTTTAATTTTTTTTISASAAVASTITMRATSPSNLTQSVCQTDASNKRNVRENSLSLDDTTNTTTATTTTDSMLAIDEMTIMSSPLQICKERSPSSSAVNNLDRDSSSPVSHSGKKFKK